VASPCLFIEASWRERRGGANLDDKKSGLFKDMLYTDLFLSSFKKPSGKSKRVVLTMGLWQKI
jgi:hypothetical protein